MTTSGVNLYAINGTERKLDLTLEDVVSGVGISSMAYSRGEEWLAVAGNGVVRVSSPGALIDLYTIYQPNSAQGTPAPLPWSVAFSADNAFLAVGWSDGQIRLYWASDGSFLRSWQAHPEAVKRLAFAPNGRLLASLGAEGSLRLWGVSQ